MSREAFIGAIEADPTDENARLVFADWCEEQGEIELAKELRGGSFKMLRPCMDTTLETLADDYDWGEVFGEKSCGNTTDQTDPCPPGSDVDTTPPKRADVVEILAASIEKGDWAETECLGVFRLKDGRYLIAEGSCDSTGWD